MKRIQKILIAVVVVIVVAGVTLFMTYQQSLHAVSKNDEKVQFSVVEGMSHEDVINALDENGLIKSKFFTQLFLKFNPYPIIQVNTYQLNKNMDVKTIFDIISTGSYENLVQEGFTVNEGLTIPEIANIVAEELNISQTEVLNKWKDKTFLESIIDQYNFIDEDILNEQLLYPLEGYLYPETYSTVGVEASVEAYTKLMLDMSETVLAPYLTQIKDTGMSVHEFLTFTSIVERESLYDKDKPMIAGVFKNRLDIDMNLQSDITVLYALQRTGLDISYEDLEIDSPYNTYMYKGLPVGPISSVYKTTIEACLNPIKHDNLFFFALEDGNVIYSKTLEEHDKAVEENIWY